METGETLDRQVLVEKERAYVGKAKVALLDLVFDTSEVNAARPLDHRNVARLVKVFQLEGCLRLEPEHHIPALIQKSTLDDSLHALDLNPALLTTYGEPFRLTVDKPLLCLHGRHRLAAAKEHLSPEDKWWVVDLYLDGTFS